ncbi:nocturnin-like [Saccoglossus kowalevskii]|uniref:Nocturnin n=1 Tax=Saccoglossus kowalevskii TaxID=10224 RepID=A0ABM0GJZ3_SACKO|nr:PREDICTED: nocturnin-like [Saccoglossus kowalevskii]
MGQTKTRMATNQLLLGQCREALKGHPPLLTRKFQKIQYTGNPSMGENPQGPSIRIMQWNVLADALCQSRDDFIRSPPDSLLWQTRKFRSLEEILTYDPDIICLEEVDHYHDFYNPMLQSIGYQGTFKPKPDSPCVYCLDHNGPDGCALFYKQDKFDMIDGITPNLTIPDVTKGSRTTNQVAIIYTLRCRKKSFEGKSLVVGVTHLKAKNGWQELRHAQGKILLEHLNKQSRGRPIVFCGDFNAESSEPVYSEFQNSNLNLKSTYQLLSENGNTEPEYTTWKIRPSGEAKHTIDYIWHSEDQLTIDALLPIPTDSQLGDERAPSYITSSDHFSLVFDLRFKSSAKGSASL